MTTNIEKADKTMVKINSIDGVYSRPIKSVCSNIKHIPKDNIYRITIDLPANRLGGDKCVAQVLDCSDSLNLIPILAFIDPKEVT